VEPLLAQRGSRALLARELGLHRSQVSKFFRRKSAMPDAERTLQLLVWLARQRRPGKA
jgi:transcriptional regulator with XRE-family HTH domain